MWKNKLFNSEQALSKYVNNLGKPDDEKTPEKFKGLGKPEIRLSFGTVQWIGFSLDDNVVPTLDNDDECYTRDEADQFFQQYGRYPEAPICEGT